MSNKQKAMEGVVLNESFNSVSVLVDTVTQRGDQYIETIVQQTIQQIESGYVPPNPKAEHASDFVWRLRPSQLRALALQEFLSPPPIWGAKINLANLYIGAEHSERITRSLILNETVTSLDLSGCDIGTAGCVKLMSCLERNSTLKHLSLNGNYLEPRAAEAAKKVMGKLESLHLACNRLGDRGFLELAEGLRESKTLQFLNVRANGATGFGIFRLIEAMDMNLLNKLSDTTRDELAKLRQQMHKNEATLRSLAPQPPPTPQQMGSPMSDASGTGTGFRRNTVLDLTKKLMATNSAHTPTEAGSPRRLSNVVRRSIASRESSAQPRDALSDSKRISSSSSAFAATVNSVEEERPPTPLTLPFATTQNNTSCNALWVNGNISVPKELLDGLKDILAARFPVPPEGALAKKKKGGKKSKK